jgi:signal transduction histidine kinase
MTNEKLTFQTERTNTDKSLSEERKKTNESISQANGAAEKKTDASVQTHRDKADEITLTARKRTDSEPDFSASRNNTVSNQRLNEERSRSDIAVEQERARVDLAMIQEREIKSIIESNRFHQERVKTDESLAVERTYTDSVVSKGMDQLSTEVTEHAKTKDSLTTRDEFLTIVSHDLRNPIGAVSSCMELLLAESADRSFSEDTKSWLQLAKRNADSSLRLIGDILDLERLAEGKLELSMANNDIKSLAIESTESFFHLAGLKNISISHDQVVAGDVSCDRGRVTQILSNLIGNAIKFTPRNGTIELKTTWTSDSVTVSVTDNGPGIQKKELKNIFEKFAQLKSKDRTGLGLGLYISKMLVEAHQGILWVESSLGEGSTFSFRLPVITAP